MITSINQFKQINEANDNSSWQVSALQATSEEDILAFYATLGLTDTSAITTQNQGSNVYVFFNDELIGVIDLAKSEIKWKELDYESMNQLADVNSLTEGTKYLIEDENGKRRIVKTKTQPKKDDLVSDVDGKKRTVSKFIKIVKEHVLNENNSILLNQINTLDKWIMHNCPDKKLQFEYENEAESFLADHGDYWNNAVKENEHGVHALIESYLDRATALGFSFNKNGSVIEENHVHDNPYFTSNDMVAFANWITGKSEYTINDVTNFLINTKRTNVIDGH